MSAAKRYMARVLARLTPQDPQDRHFLIGYLVFEGILWGTALFAAGLAMLIWLVFGT